MAWEPGDPIERHPLYADQIELEMDMVRRGAEKFRATVATARDREEMTRLRPFRRLMENLVADMGAATKGWLERVGRARGVTPMAYHKLKGMDPYEVSFITVQAVLNRITIENLNIAGVANEIGLAVEHEARMEAWLQSSAKGLFWDTQDQLRRQKATGVHRRRVNIHRFNELVKDGTLWDVQTPAWTSDERKHVGLRLIDLLIRSTKRFHLEQAAPVRDQKYRPPYVLRADPEMLEHLIAAVEDEEEHHPPHLPTIIPPRRWDGVRKGGYYTPAAKTPSLIRFKADNEEQRGAALDDYDSLAMPSVYTALHYLQETPWRINQRVLQVALKVWDADLGIAGFLRREPRAIPPRPPEADTNPEVDKEWRREATKTYAYNAALASKTMIARDTLGLAAEFSAREFYFPHMLDFRGRIYPVPSMLHPQGADLARGLLTFANGRPVGEHGAGWLGVHLANCWGNDKVSNDERIEWAYDNEDLWRRIAADPLRNREWCDRAAGRKDPWQTLAAIFEWVRFLDEGPSMVSSLPIRVDGTCNGLQHLSAMMRDEDGGRSVNLYPSNRPRDIYREAAEKLQHKLHDLEDDAGTSGRMARLWLDVFDERTIPRSFTKQPVMVLPYGGTKSSYFGAVWDWLKENDPEETRLPAAERKAAVPWIADRLWDAVSEIVTTAMQAMRWLKECAKVLAETGAPLFWWTPSGFVVRHFYGTPKKRDIETHIDGKRLRIVDYAITKKLSKQDQLQGIAPNFVHSMDASALMESISLLAQMDDHPPLTAIHDAYGTVAGAMWDLHAVLREGFVRVHEGDALETFRKDCVGQYRSFLLGTREDVTPEIAERLAEIAVPATPPKGSLDLSLVREADYFFA